MNCDPLRHWREVWLVDFEFHQPAGERPTVLCMVRREYRTGRTFRAWGDVLAAMSVPPFPVGADSLLVAYFASAELSCFRALNWPQPVRVLDLFCEFRCLTNGQPTISGNGLLGALAHFGLPACEGAEKAEMRELAMRGAPYTADEKTALLDYCESDVMALAKLLPAMMPCIDFPRALLRGRYMTAVASMEWTGVPIDVGALGSLRANWEAIQGELIGRIDSGYGVFDGRTFKRDRFAAWLIRNSIPWPRLESGTLDLSNDVFRQMARTWPAVAPLRELRHSLGEMRLESLAVGGDGRNRCLLSPFASTTSRNQPSNTKFIFGPSCWLRALIKPEPGRAVAYVDWSQQEFAIAAALSEDEAMRAAYGSSDPYLSFAKQAGLVPADATKATHPAERERCKVCILATQYGMGSRALAQTLGQPEVYARQLLHLHRQTYPRFWRWSEANVDHAMLRGKLWTVFGWDMQTGQNANPRGLANFLMQANGAEMMRLACCLATERGVQVCCPVHDALLVEGPADQIGSVVMETQSVMAEAGKVILNGFELRTDAKVFSHPDRYMDPRGEEMWNTVTAMLKDFEAR